LLIRPTAFENSSISSSTTTIVEPLIIEKALEHSSLSSFISSEATISERPDLTAARGNLIDIFNLLSCNGL